MPDFAEGKCWLMFTSRQVMAPYTSRYSSVVIIARRAWIKNHFVAVIGGHLSSSST